MLPEKIFNLPAAQLDQPPPQKEWGTRIAEFRGVFYTLFLADVSEETYWPEGFPLEATCVIRSDPQGNHTQILEIGTPKSPAERP
jgi:hypothetical protein